MDKGWENFKGPTQEMAITVNFCPNGMAFKVSPLWQGKLILQNDFSFSGGLVYQFFGTSESQKWAKNAKSENTFHENDQLMTNTSVQL